MTEQVKNPPQTWEELEAWIDANPKSLVSMILLKADPQSFCAYGNRLTTGGLGQVQGRYGSCTGEGG